MKNRKTTFHRAKFNNGFSAIEVMLAVVVLVFGLIPMITIFSRISTGLANRQQEIEAGALATNLLEQVQRLKWDEVTTAGGEYIDLALVAPLGPDSGEATPSDYDDIDDYHGYTDKVGEFTREVNVLFCHDTNGQIETTASVDNIKLIRITVTWTQGIPRSQTFETIKMNGTGA